MRVLFVLKQLDYEPVGLMQMSSVLKAAGHDVRLAVADRENVEDVVASWRPGILAYSVWTGGQRYFLALNRRLRQHTHAFSAFGGPHATFFPEMIEADDLVDGLCVGEGEGALLDLADALERGQLDTSIPNWHFRTERGIVRNTVRDAVPDLDAMPAPDRDLIYDADPDLAQSPIKHFITGRGCPYDCSYCFNHAWAEIYRGKGHRVRKQCVARVLEEIEYVRARWPLGFVVFLDDTFVLNRAWLQEFAPEYRRRVGLPFFCNVRVNLVTPELANQLRAAGCVSVGMGVETADDRLRNEVLKRNMTRSQIVDACRVLREAGLAVLTTNMLALPGGGLAQDLETLKLNIDCRPAFANAFLFQPYPRTELGERAFSLGLVEGDVDSIGESAWEASALRFPPAEKHQIENLQKLFAVTVRFPWLYRLTVRALRLPHNRLFWLVHKLWKGYAIKSRVHPVKMSLRDYVRAGRRFMKLG